MSSEVKSGFVWRDRDRGRESEGGRGREESESERARASIIIIIFSKGGESVPVHNPNMKVIVSRGEMQATCLRADKKHVCSIDIWAQGVHVYHSFGLHQLLNVFSQFITLSGLSTQVRVL